MSGGHVDEDVVSHLSARRIACLPPIGFLRPVLEVVGESRLCLQDPESELPLLTLLAGRPLVGCWRSRHLSARPALDQMTSNVPRQSEHVGLPAGLSIG